MRAGNPAVGSCFVPSAGRRYNRYSFQVFPGDVYEFQICRIGTLLTSRSRIYFQCSPVIILFGPVVFVLVRSLFLLPLLFSFNAGLMWFNLFGYFDNPLVESFKLLVSQPFADIDKQTGIKNRLGGYAPESV